MAARNFIDVISQSVNGETCPIKATSSSSSTAPYSSVQDGVLFSHHHQFTNFSDQSAELQNSLNVLQHQIQNMPVGHASTRMNFNCHKYSDFLSEKSNRGIIRPLTTNFSVASHAAEQAAQDSEAVADMNVDVSKMSKQDQWRMKKAMMYSGLAGTFSLVANYLCFLGARLEFKAAMVLLKDARHAQNEFAHVQQSDRYVAQAVNRADARQEASDLTFCSLIIV